jgi:hypothetical protein
MASELYFTYHTSQRQRFQDGFLVSEWASRYPVLFDERDIELATNQPNYHFFEWLSAVLLYESTGYLSLLENYSAKNHPAKLESFRTIVPNEISDSVIQNQSGIPDLFCYHPTTKDWMFFEVKGGRDKIRSNQEQRIAELEALSGKPIWIINLKEIFS